MVRRKAAEVAGRRREPGKAFGPAGVPHISPSCGRKEPAADIRPGGEDPL
ncbi:hypothetical protein B4135_1162 [Caldibacillus debilis]|uniref:Uncharacterized protein n=1 Tax=Caldibacillus debilis TaxID=301148 RepID=A0A150MEF8_9BACI|nr:hypothetical protein B4135_1162 [Caldibacillus debilis]